jgi:hypothetical protein
MKLFPSMQPLLALVEVSFLGRPEFSDPNNPQIDWAIVMFKLSKMMNCLIIRMIFE